VAAFTLEDDKDNGQARRLSLAVLEERIEGLRREIELRHAGYKEALEIASAEVSRRLDILNGHQEQQLQTWREGHQDVLLQQRNYVPQPIYDQNCKTFERRIGELENTASQGSGWTLMLKVVAGAIVVSLVGVMIAYLFHLAARAPGLP
jgi:hypothetical protein